MMHLKDCGEQVMLSGYASSSILRSLMDRLKNMVSGDFPLSALVLPRRHLVVVQYFFRVAAVCMTDGFSDVFPRHNYSIRLTLAG